MEQHPQPQTGAPAKAPPPESPTSLALSAAIIVAVLGIAWVGIGRSEPFAARIGSADGAAREQQQDDGVDAISTPADDKGSAPDAVTPADHPSGIAAAPTPAADAPRLPAGFPSDFPVLDGANLERVSGSEDAGAMHWDADWTASIPAADAESSYAALLWRRGWRVTSSDRFAEGGLVTFERGDGASSAEGWLAFSPGGPEAIDGTSIGLSLTSPKR